MDAMFGTGGTLDGLREVRERGWCRHFGINGRDLTFLRECVLSNQFDTLLVFQRFDLFEQSALELFQEAHSRDMGIIVGSPLRLGLFGSARDQLVAHLDGDDRRHLEELETLLSDYPGGIATAALRFALMPPEVSVVLSGASSPEEIANVVEAVQVGTPALPTELFEAIKRLASGKHRKL
jgi:aryl-alcohol dehydrogenase-like predicted oxidoreductase